MLPLQEIDVTELYGVGRAKAKAYASVGVRSVFDLIYYFPRAYENRQNISLLSHADTDCKSALILTVATEPKISNIRRGMSLLKFRAFDESDTCEIIYFNQNYLKEKFPIGSTFRFWGKVERKKSKLVISSPDAEPWIENIPLPPFRSVYRLTDGLSQKQISQNIETALSMATKSLCDPLPEEIRQRHSLCTIHYALRQIHFPESYAALAIAKKRLIFDEFFFFAASLGSQRGKIRKLTAPKCASVDLSPLLASLPYKLTGAQNKVIAEISSDMAKNEPMNRILIGDVGCGKTVCAAAAIYIAVKNRYQAALMAPTEILAVQHFKDLSPLFEALGIKVALLIGATTPSQKKKIYAAMSAEGEKSRIDVVIGTQALLSEGAEFISPGLVVTDEQHRFGVKQRALLSEKNKHTHVLVMSATPIPRSLALVMYGDLKMSKIDEMPLGRQRVDTFLVDDDYRDRLDAFIKKNVDGGGQVYIVCPAVDEQELENDEIELYDILIDSACPRENKKPPLKAAVKYAQELQERLEGYSVAFVHGKMRSREKDKIMSDFASGKIQILVSTTVIEVGVNVPTACLMIVENAERFGLSQLHQLRGRVGRGKIKSYCVLVGGDKLARLGGNARRRLETMCNSYNGFEIAEQDLKLRGPGDFLSLSANSSIRQSGAVSFRLADMCEDAELMNGAFVAAHALIESDPTLENHPSTRDFAENLFISHGDIIS